MIFPPVSIVIPAYNEADSIRETIDEIVMICKKAEIHEYEIIVVNDGSTDGTAEKINNINSLVVIHHPHNIGYGRSLKDGIKIAKYDAILITDADNTYPIDQIPVLLKVYAEGFDMVVGARSGAHYQESMIKTPLRSVLRFIVEFAAERKIPDINSGLRVFSKSKIMPMLTRLCNTFSFTTSMTLGFMMSGYFVKYIDIPYYERKGKTKVKLFKDSLRTMQYILQAINYYNPIKLFLLFTGFCIFLSAIFFTTALITHVRTLFSLGVATSVAGLIVLCFGLLADLLKQIMDKNAVS